MEIDVSFQAARNVLVPDRCRGGFRRREARRRLMVQTRAFPLIPWGGGPAPGGHKGWWREEKLPIGTPPIDHFEKTIGECLLGESHRLCSKQSEPGSPSRANLSPLIKAIKSVSAAQYLIPGALGRAAGFFIGGVDHVLGSWRLVTRKFKKRR